MKLACLFFCALPVMAGLGAPVPLTITDRSGTARTNEGVTTGVAIPQSAAILDVRNLMLATSNSGNCSGGSAVDSMMHVVERWNGAPNNATRPIRWVWVETVVPSLPANGSVVYCLEDRTGPDPGTTTLTVANSAGFITVNTGAMTFKVSTSAFNFLDTVTVGSTPVVASSAANTWKVTAGGVDYTTSNTDNTYAAVVEYPGVTPDANSSGENIRAQIKVSGRFTSADGTRKFLYEMRLFAYASSTSITCRPVFTFAEDAFAAANKPTDIVMTLPLALGGGARTYTFGANGGGATSGTMNTGDDVYLLQYDHGNKTPAMLKGYTIVKNGADTADNYQAPGWVDINDGSVGATVWVRDFWQRYPMELEINGSALNVHLWPVHANSVVSGVGDGVTGINDQVFAAKRNGMLSGAQPGISYTGIWPYAGGAAMELTPITGNLGRPVITMSQGTTTTISAYLSINDTGGGGYCTTQAAPSCHYWPAGTTQQAYLAKFAGCWAPLNGFQTVTFTGSYSSSGIPIFTIPVDTSQCNLPLPHALNQGTSNDPIISNIDTLTDMQPQGAAEEWEIHYQFYAGSVPSPAGTASALKDRLMLVNQAWLASSQAFGRIKEVDTAEFPIAEANLVNAWNTFTTEVNNTNLYGAVNYGDTLYDPSTPPSGYGGRAWAFSRKGWELTPWMMYARTGDPQYLNWGIAITLHGIDIDLQHINVSQYTDANNNVVTKHIGGGICSHSPAHWFSVYSGYTGTLRTGYPLSWDCSEGQEPGLDYVAEAAEALYTMAAFDRGKEIALNQLSHTQYIISKFGGSVGYIAGRAFGGCLTLATVANRLAWTGMSLAETCFARSINEGDGNLSVGNPDGIVQGDIYNNGIDWAYFADSWVQYSFPEYADQDPNYCAPDVHNVSHCVQGEFLRFAEAFMGMGKTSDAFGLFWYNMVGKTPMNAYALSGNNVYLRYMQRIFQNYYSDFNGVGTSVDVHYWAPFILNVPFAEAALSGKGSLTPPDNPPYPVTIPSDGSTLTFLVNKTTDQSWTFTFSVDTGNDFGGDPSMLAGTVSFDVYNPSGTLVQHNAVSACTYGVPNPCIPNSWYPVQSATAVAGQGESITYGGTDNRVLAFTVPADGITGEYTIKLSVVNGTGGTCVGSPMDRFYCYSTTHFAYPLGTSLGNLSMVTPNVLDSLAECSPTLHTPHVGRGLYYFNVPPGTAQVRASMSRYNTSLISPSGKFYAYGTTNNVAPEPGIWALVSDANLDDGWGKGFCIQLSGVKPLLSASPQTYYDSPNVTVSTGTSNYPGVTMNFSTTRPPAR